MKRLFPAFFLLSLTTCAFADTSIKAEVDKTSITADEAIIYKLTVSSDERSLPEPKLPSFDGFAVAYSTQSSTMSFAKNSVRASVVYSLILAPQDTGKFSIEPAEVKVRGKTYSSQAFEIEVRQGARPIQPPQKQTPALPGKELPESKEPQISL
jgi:hypothetical protein